MTPEQLSEPVNLREIIADLERMRDAARSAKSQIERLSLYGHYAMALAIHSDDLIAAARERDELRKLIDEKSAHVCLYCCTTFAKGPEGRAAFAEHVKTCTKHPMHAVIRERDSLRSQVARLREVVKECEWSYVRDDRYMACPICRNRKPDRHATDCRLAEALKEAGNG